MADQAKAAKRADAGFKKETR
ncbi:hypothetical protein GQ600_25673 [Phytophthora cactorum]|nr:hypothetical protein GQ600_25673 [Phytophthora cactorum]